MFVVRCLGASRAAALAGIGASALFVGAASGGVMFQTGNIQFTNVNIAADQHAFTIEGEVDHLGVAVYFDGFGASPSYAPIELHGQHGVAFVEAFNPMDMVYRMTIRAQTGYAFDQIDWKLDAVPPNDGMVTFVALDAMGMAIPLSGGTDTFAFSHTGQNPFHVHTDGGSAISTLVMTSTVPILDLKQVSVNLIPGPGSLGLMACGLVLLPRRRR